MVKPPQIPTFRNNMNLGFIRFDFAANTAVIPIIKEPAMFIISVYRPYESAGADNDTINHDRHPFLNL